MNTPFEQFAEWFALAQEREPADANACAIATVDLSTGTPRPDVRIVLMKDFDARGFVVFTNYESAKGRQLAACPFATLDFHWKSVKRQVRISGVTSKVDRAESEAYFATRHRDSQLSAWASLQSQAMDQRDTYETALANMAERFPDVVPCPPHWGGYRLTPDWIEFWEDRPGRQHVRERFDRVNGQWESRMLYP